MNDIGEVEVRNLDFIDIGVKEFEEVVGDRGFFGVFHTNSELVRVVGRQVQGQGIIVSHGLDEFEKIDHINTKNELGRAVEVFKAIVIQTQINEDGVGLIYGQDLDTCGVEFQIGFGQDIFECFNEGAEGTSLNSADFKQISVCVRLGSAHIYSPDGLCV